MYVLHIRSLCLSIMPWHQKVKQYLKNICFFCSMLLFMLFSNPWEEFVAICSRVSVLHFYLSPFLPVSKQPFPDSLLFLSKAVIQSVCSNCVCMLCWIHWCVCVCLLGNEVIGVDSAEVRASVHYLHIIDNQQTLFELSHKLEPRA